MADFEAKAETLKKTMLELGVANPDFIAGCSEPEISLLEREHNVIFPHSYKVFLKYFGRGLGGKVMKDINILYDQIGGLTDLLKNEILIEANGPSLPNRAFVFAARYEEQFMFFDASGLVEEPPILYYALDDLEFTQTGKSVFDIVESEIELAIAIKTRREELRNQRKTRKNQKTN